MVETITQPRAERLAAWVLFGFSLLAFVGSLFLEANGCGIMINASRPDPASAYGILMLPLNSLSVSFLGLLIIKFRPGNRIGWVCILYGLGFPIGLLGESYGTCSITGQLGWPGEAHALWLFHFADFTTIGLVLFFWLFPDGRFLSRRWRQVAVLALSFVIGFSLLSYFWPGSIGQFIVLETELNNPLALPIVPTEFWTDLINLGKQVGGLVFALLGILTLVLRWLRSGGAVRQQIKWMAFFLMTAGTTFLLVELIGVAFFPPIFDGWFYLIELLIFWLGFPVILGFALFKFRLYEIDFYIRRTLQYAIVSAVLVAVYFGAIALIQGGLTAATGAQSPLAIVLSTLLIAALFNPLRQRVQAFVDRRFYRRKYDAQQVLATFAQTARDETDLEVVTADLVTVVQEAMQPDRVNLWLRRAQRKGTSE